MASPLDSLPVMSDVAEDDMEMPYQSIFPPMGFQPPKEAEGGKSFDAVVRGYMEGDEFVIESINGMPMDESMEAPEAEIEEITANTGDDMAGLDAAMAGMM